MPVARTGIDVGIDTAAENIIEIRVQGFPVQNPAADLVPGKRREVTDVKDKRMTPDDRPSQNILVLYDSEKGVAPRPCGDKFIFPCRIRNRGDGSSARDSFF